MFYIYYAFFGLVEISFPLNTISNCDSSIVIYCWFELELLYQVSSMVPLITKVNISETFPSSNRIIRPIRCVVLVFELSPLNIIPTLKPFISTPASQDFEVLNTPTVCWLKLSIIVLFSFFFCLLCKTYPRFLKYSASLIVAEKVIAFYYFLHLISYLLFQIS